MTLLKPATLQLASPDIQQRNGSSDPQILKRWLFEAPEALFEE
jgi:hypothetical protein